MLSLHIVTPEISLKIFRSLYSAILIFSYPLLFLFSLFNSKLKASRKGQGRADEIAEYLENNRNIIWFHAASAGEYEQISTLANKLYLTDRYRLILSVSSSTIMEKLTDHHIFEAVFYNPWDLPIRCAHYVNRIRPDIYINTRHDIWFNLLFSLKKAGTKTVLINANLYEGSTRLKWPFKGFNIAAFSLFDRIYTASEYNHKFLSQLIKTPVYITGDTRFDRVYERKENNIRNILPENILQDNTIIYGSAVDSDMPILLSAIGHEMSRFGVYVHLIVPHETDSGHLQAWKDLFSSINIKALLIEDFDRFTGEEVLIWNSVGQLADLYKYASHAYVGAGFSTGVHNVLEPAVYGIPVAHGPYFEILSEAIEMADKKISHIIHRPEDLIDFYELLPGSSDYKDNALITHEFAHSRIGASDRIIKDLGL